MGRRPHVPTELTRGPFTLEEARAAGLTLTALQSKAWRRVGSGLYCWVRWREDAWQLLQAWHRRLPSAIFTVRTAAWLHGLDVDPIRPIEVAVPASSGIRSRPGLTVRKSDIATSETIKLRGLPATTIQRTLLDVSRTLPEVEALIVLDAAVRKGLGRVNTPLGLLAETAESPMETRLRWLLLNAGLPRPIVQAKLHDARGREIARADLYYPDAKLVIEYDGTNHRDRLIDDNRRQNLLVDAGFQVLRFTAADLNQRPGTVAALVRAALRPRTPRAASPRPHRPPRPRSAA